MSTTLDQIRERYRAVTLEWAAEFGNPKRANRIFRVHHAFNKDIRDLDAGQRALLSLLDDPEPSVRSLAATHCLRFAPDEAQVVLEQLQLEDGPHALDAKYTLISYREGTLNLDW